MGIIVAVDFGALVDRGVLGSFGVGVIVGVVVGNGAGVRVAVGFGVSVNFGIGVGGMVCIAATRVLVSGISLSLPQATNKIVVTMRKITYTNVFSVIQYAI